MVLVEPVCGKERHSCYNFDKAYVHACVRPSGFVQAITHTVMHGFQFFFCTFVVPKEEKCHLKHFLGRLKVKVMLEGHIN